MLHGTNVKIVSGSIVVRISIRPVFISSRRCRHRELVTGVAEFASVGNPGDYHLFNFRCIRDLFGFSAALITRA
jgi:hypothetical protein